MPELPTPTNKLRFSLDLRVISSLLLVIIAVMLALWRPWQPSYGANTRTITVTGGAKITSEPDEYVFYPSYQFKNDDKSAALKELSAKSDELIAKIKNLGVEDSKIKTNSNGYESRLYYPENSKDATYTLTLTVTVSNRELAQKVQDYLITTSPSGSVSPQANFSETKRKQLESQARDKATKEAREKADQSAKNLGFKVGAVKSVEDGAGFGDIYPMAGDSLAVGSQGSEKLAVQPGENELNYSVTVVYFVR